MIRNLSFKVKIALTVSLLFLLFGAITAFLTISNMENKFRELLGEQQYNLACSISKILDDKLLFAQKSLLAASVKAPAEVSANNLDAAQKFLNDRVTLHSIFDNRLFLFDNTGRMLANSPSTSNREEMNTEIRDCITRTIAARKPMISSPFLSKQTHLGSIIMMTAPVCDKRGELILILCGSFRLQGTTLLDNLPKMRIGRSGYLSLSTSDRITLMHPDPAKLMDIYAEKGKNSLFDRAVEGFDGMDEIVGSSVRLELTSFIHMQNVNWILGIHNPTDDAYSIMYTQRKYMFAGFAAGTLGMLIITWLTVQRMTSPLISITRQVQAMRTGPLVPISSFALDEIGTLANAFNELVETVHTQQEYLREEERKYRIVADNAYTWEFWLSPDNRTLYSSPSCSRITGFKSCSFQEYDEMMARILFPEDREIFENHRHEVRGGAQLRSLEFRIVRADGSIRWISHLCQPIYDHDGTHLGTRGSNRDITPRKQAEQTFNELLSQQLAIINNIPDMAWLKDRKGDYLVVNEEFCRMSGLASESVIGKNDTDIWPPDLAVKYLDGDNEVINSGKRKYFEEYVVDRNGKLYYVETVKTPIYNAGKEMIGIIGIAHDITIRKQEELQLRHANNHEPLTGLYNRAFFDQEMDRLSIGRKFPVSIIMVDVNDLKLVNDTLGHSMGDILLQLVAQAILEVFRAEDVVARIGGDEFAVLLPDTDEAAARDAIVRIVENIKSFNLSETRFRISIALGVATAEHEGELQQALILSDQQMYLNKAAMKSSSTDAESAWAFPSATVSLPSIKGPC